MCLWFLGFLVVKGWLQHSVSVSVPKFSTVNCLLFLAHIQPFSEIFWVSGVGLSGPLCPKLAHCCTKFLKSSGYRNIAQGGDPIRWGRLEMKLPRPNYTKLDPFFCKKGGFYIFQSKAFFLGSCRSLFWALGTVSQKWGGFPKNEGGFYALSVFLMWYYETSLQSNTKTN